MRYLLCLFIASLLLPSVHATDPAYQEALDRALKDYPPGDYGDRPVRSFNRNRAPEKPVERISLELELLRAVEPSDRDIKTLFSEAGSYFAEGRWDLAFKRYKQILLLDPENVPAKVNLYDITMLRCLYSADAVSREAWRYYDAVKQRISKETPLSGSK